MTILDRLRGRAPTAIDRTPPNLVPANGLIEVIDSKAVQGGPWLTSLQSGPLLSSYATTPQQKAAMYLRAYKCGWFYKAESKISRDIAMLTVAVAPEDEGGDNEQQRVQPDLRTPLEQLDPIGQFLRLMERPNPSYTGRTLRQKTQIRIDMAGAAFWYLENGDFGLPSAIYGISPARMTPSVDRDGNLIGWVMDADAPSGGVPFSTREILPFITANPDDDQTYGVGVVEAVYAELPLTDLMARHTADLLTTGGRLAGMMWPRERSLGPDEYSDALKAWRNTVDNPNAARRMLIFPEPMEYASGASTPAEIGIPDLATLNRDNILTAFPIDPTMLGVPMPSGLNASGETRKELRKAYWAETIHPRVELLEEVIQVGLLARYEEQVGGSWDFDIEEPNLDDATSLIEKAGAFKALVGIGFDAKETVAAVGLDQIKWNGLPAILDPAQQLQMQQQAAQAAQQQQGQNGPSVAVGDSNRRDPSQVQQQVAKSAKAAAEEHRDAANAAVVPDATRELSAFLSAQQERLVANITKSFPVKSQRQTWAKADPDWWDAAYEDAALTDTLRGLYLRIGKAGLQAVADTLERIVQKSHVSAILDDLLAYGGDRIVDINATTKAAVQQTLAEGVRRGYSLNQLIEGKPDEGYTGIKGVLLDNGTPAFGDLRSETIARTETMLSYNRSTVTGYGEFGVERLLAYDGDDDAECASRDGADFAIDEALSIEDHPNGTLVWSPLLSKSAKTLTVAPKWEPTFKISVDPEITIHQPEIRVGQPDVTVLPAPVTVQAAEAPVVNVDSPIVNVKVPEAVVNVAVPESPAPVVQVTNEVKTPSVTVEAPQVTVAAPDVKVEPIVTVKAPKVTMPAEFRITGMPDRVTRRKVDRDKSGRITDTTDVETDA